MFRRMGMLGLLRFIFRARCMAWRRICTRYSFRLLELVRAGRGSVRAADFQGEGSAAEALVAAGAGRFEGQFSVVSSQFSVKLSSDPPPGFGEAAQSAECTSSISRIILGKTG